MNNLDLKLDMALADLDELLYEMVEQNDEDVMCFTFEELTALRSLLRECKDVNLNYLLTRGITKEVNKQHGSRLRSTRNGNGLSRNKESKLRE